MVEQMIKLKKFEEDLGEDLDADERLYAVKEKLGIDKNRYEEIKDYQNLFGSRLTSLDIDIGEDDSIALSELISIDESDDTVFDQASTNILKEGVRLGLETLSKREADILKMRYGIGEGRESTLEEIGDKYGLTRERIRQIESKALWKLKNKKRIAQLKDGYID